MLSHQKEAKGFLHAIQGKAQTVHLYVFCQNNNGRAKRRDTNKKHTGAFMILFFASSQRGFLLL